MTMPVSVSTPSAAPANGKGAPVSGPSPKAKVHEDTDTEASGVADMFAALVATLTEQMQPVAEEATVTGEIGEIAEVTGENLAAEATPVEAFLTAPVLLPAAPALAEVPTERATKATVTAPVVAGAQIVAAPEIAADPNALADPNLAPIPDGDVEEAPATHLAPVEDGDHRATPAVPAKGEVDDTATAVASRATPADPATDEHQARPLLPMQAAPAAQAAAAVAPAPQPATSAPADTSATDSNGIPVVNLNGPAGPARAQALAPVVAPPPAPVADAHVQVARVVRPLRLSTDGAYELALDLTPAELGRVRIDVELRGSTISLNMRADNPATRELLASSLHQLRSELESAGLHAGHLDVGGRGTDGSGAPGQDRRPGEGTTSVTDETAAAPAAFTDSLTDDSVDVRA